MYLMRKRFNNTKSNANIINSSIKKIIKDVYASGVDGVKKSLIINPNIYNNNIQSLYYTSKINGTSLLNLSSNTLFVDPLFGSCTVFEYLKQFYGIIQIEKYIGLIKDDNYDDVFKELNIELIQKIRYDLVLLKNSFISDTGPSIIDLYDNMFLSIVEFYYMYIEIENKNTLFEKYKNDSDILNNKQKLNDFLNESKTKLNTIAKIAVDAPKAVIKPEYLEYFKLYGLPNELGFDPFKLQEIIERLY